MKTFKEFIDEMAVNTGNSPKGAFSKEQEFYKLNNLKVIKKNLPGDYTVLKGETDYFLSKNNEYKGHIEFTKKGDVLSINHSHSEIKKGFYELMFSVILTECKEILSDISLSSQALKSYSNLNRNVSIFELAIKIGKSYKPYSEEDLLSSRRAKISIKAKHIMSEVFEDYYNKLKTPLYKLEKSKNNGLYEYTLFHEGWDNY
jgi:hypothetical protein